MARSKICVSAGCDEIELLGQSHCEEHKAARKAKPKARRNKAQTSPAAIASRLLYADPKWKAARLVHLRSNPVCKDCDELGVVVVATDVDHITPHKGDRKLFWDRSNWQSLCHRCHSRKTAREVFHQ